MSFTEVYTDRHCKYNVTSQRVRFTAVAIEARQCVVCVVEFYVTVNNIYILILTQKLFMENLCYRQTQAERRSSRTVPIFSSDSNYVVSGQILLRVSNNKFHIIPSSRGRANILGRTDLTELIGAPYTYERTPQTRIG